MSESAESAPGASGRLPARLRRLLGARPLLAKLLENVGWLLSERVALMLTGFAVNVWFVRYLGPDQYGAYSYALSFGALFAAVATLGTDAVIVRELARHPGNEGVILGTAFRLRVVSGALAWLAAALLALPLRGDTQTRIMVALVAANALSTAPAVFENWFHANIAARKLVLARTGVNLASQGARCILILGGAPLVAFGALFVITGWATGCLTYVLYRSTKGSVRPRFSGSLAKQLLYDSWPLIFVTVSIAVYMKIDQVMLAAMAGDRENGIYATAVVLSELWYFIPVSVASTAFPVIIKWRADLGAEEFARRMQTFYDAMVAIGYSVALPVIALAGPMVAFLFGPQYGESVSVLRVHVASFVFVCIGLARGRYLLAENWTRFIMVTAVTTAGLNVALNLVFIPRWGALGAAWSTLISYAGANYFSGLFAKRVRPHTWLLTRALVFPLRRDVLTKLTSRARALKWY